MNIEQMTQHYGNNFFPKIREELIKLGTEKPDFVYNTNPDEWGCSYNGPALGANYNPVGPECSGCIVGQALQRLGWDDPKELKYHGHVHKLIPFCPDDICEVQKYQDCGESWGQAIKLLKSVFA